MEKEIGRKLFIDDVRQPIDCIGYMHQRIGKENPIYLEKDWIVVKNYPEFIAYIMDNGIPDLISFDHDLAEGHYHQNMQEGQINYESDDFKEDDYNKTGYHCAHWLINFCQANLLEFPKYYVHSFNPVGTENIISLIESYKNRKL